MNKFILILLTLPLMILSQENHSTQEDLGPSIRLETGLYVPIGTFQNTINNSPFFNITAGIPLDNKWRLDPSLTLFFPQSKNNIMIEGDEGLIEGRINSLSGHFGASINRVKKWGSRTYVEARLGTGISFVQTDKKRKNASRDSNDRFYGSETIYLQGGCGLKFSVFKQSYIGLEFNYYFTPYNLFGERFVGNIGNQAMSLGISYGL